jgi:hypothetical protein
MKRFKVIGCIVALFALVSANVWNAVTGMKASALHVENVENVAEGIEWSFSGSDRNKAGEGTPIDCKVDKWVKLDANAEFHYPGGVFKGDANCDAGAWKHIHYEYEGKKCGKGGGDCVEILCE